MLWPRIALICVGTVLATTGLIAMRESEQPAPSAVPTPAAAATLAPRTPLAVLVLPPGNSDVHLSAFPDWLANESPPASLRAIVAVRGTMGIASVEGLRVVNWTERGVSYRIESTTRTVSELVGIADSLR